MTATTSTTLPTGSYTVDTAHSRIGFVARHAMVTKVRGTFNAFEGAFEITDDLSSSWAKVSLDATSVDTGSAQRDEHVRSEDFLAVATHPSITFASTHVEPLNGESLRVTGDLTVKGVTHPVTIDLDYTGTATDPFGNTRVGFESSTQINRKDWGLTWNVALEAGGLLVSDKVVLEFDVSAIRG